MAVKIDSMGNQLPILRFEHIAPMPSRISGRTYLISVGPGWDTSSSLSALDSIAVDVSSLA